jgi:hypothetical protein
MIDRPLIQVLRAIAIGFALFGIRLKSLNADLVALNDATDLPPWEGV